MSNNSFVKEFIDFIPVSAGLGFCPQQVQTGLRKEGFQLFPQRLLGEEGGP